MKDREPRDIETFLDPAEDVPTREQAFSLRRSLWELFRVLLAAAVLSGVFLVFFRASLVRGSSMEPTLRDGDCILVRTAGYDDPRRGDIVAIKARDREDKHLVKRIIALAGDTVHIDFEAGIVFVNGQRLEEPYAAEPTRLSGELTFPVTVPPGCCFVLGDNRNHSQDSRSAALGFVPLEDLEGKAVFRFAPLSRFGPIEREE